ncbi:MAG: HEAT repeat domain-containing protein [Kofleriaceae bacterium]
MKTLMAFVMVAGCSSQEPSAMVMASANPVGAAPQINSAAPDLERYERIVRNLEDCPLEGYQVARSCPGMQMFSSGIANVDPEIKRAVGHDMLASKSPAVRVKAAELVGASGRDAIADAAARERDPGVLRAFVHALAGDGASSPKVARVLLAAADHANVDVRLQAVYALALPANRGLAGGAAKLASLAEHDADRKVRSVACEQAGKLGSDELIPLYERATATAADPDHYAACMEGLAAMFHNHPAFDTASEPAYRLFLRRLDAKPRTEHTPPWTVMSTFCYFSHESDLGKLAAWKQRAPWFDPREMKRAMSGVIADRHASWMARAAAVESMVGLGATKTELEALRRGYSAGDSNARPLLNKIASAIRE